MARSRKAVDIEREVLPTPDGDTVILDHLSGQERRDTSTPRLLILHGLEGSSFSSYAQSMLSICQRMGIRGTAFNFRSCARRLDDRRTWIPNGRPRLYHSGETADLDHIVRTLQKREPETQLIAVGVSLGGNVLLKWLGEHGDQDTIVAAATISVPYDLGAGARNLRTTTGRIYFRHFLSTLLPKLAHLQATFPELRDRIDLDAARRSRDFVAYDEAATAPLHGFDGAEDYYRRSNSIGFVDRISTPTLCVNAADDPFLPRSVLDEVRERASESVEFKFTDAGGHVGFVAGRSPLSQYSWAEEFVMSWLRGHISMT
jgi:predicted alpha/beta-fold hydrolase